VACRGGLGGGGIDVKCFFSFFSFFTSVNAFPAQALELLSTLPECEAALAGDGNLELETSLLEHAFQAGEAARLAYPDADWLHLVALIHGLGRLLVHERWAPPPFPLGRAQ
jgi:Myo-inositol oxygenase